MGVIRQRLSDLSEDRGETEVLQYGGMKWTVKDAKRYGDALAAGLAEMAVGPGDAVASLLAPDAPEAHCAQLAAAVSGVVYCAVDPALGADGVRAALVESGAKVLLHGGAEETVALLAAAVPGFGAYEARAGVGFYSPAAPQLKYFVSTGLDMQPASANYQHLLALDGGRYAAGEPVADDALLGKAYAAGGAASWTHREAIEQDAYPALTAVLNLQPAVYP
mmetsp:Transcript_10149/g.31287  ORF Transcript_10149/g.31287 Transcript_10149/m.31287 type:complete len:221 (+) Transcript_10149:846-1508(+)